MSSNTVAKMVDAVHFSTLGNHFDTGRHHVLCKSECTVVCCVIMVKWKAKAMEKKNKLMVWCHFVCVRVCVLLYLNSTVGSGELQGLGFGQSEVG